MTEARIVPPGAPAPVERAREALLAVTVRLGEERERVTAARAAVTAAEQADRLAMAEAIGAGRDPVSDEKQIAKARAQVATCERRVEAAQLALADAQAALGQQVEEQRRAWSKKATAELEQAREAGLRALGELEQALRGMGSAHAIIGWLEPRVGGADNGRPPKLDVLPSLQASIAASPNGQPRQALEVLGWLRQALDPPRKVEPPPHQRANWPRTGTPVG